MLAAEPLAHDREGAVKVPDLTVLRHLRVLRVMERTYIQRRGVPQRSAHVAQALKGDVLIGVAGHHQARLVNAPIKGLHRVVAERLQHLAGPVQSREVPRLLELPRQVRAES